MYCHDRRNDEVENLLPELPKVRAMRVLLTTLLGRTDSNVIPVYVMH